MLHAGLETKPQDLLALSWSSFAIAIGGTFIPLLLGMGVSLVFGFTLLQSGFIGLGVSITALAVTNKIFKDFRFNQSKVAHLVMGAAILGIVEEGGSCRSC